MNSLLYAVQNMNAKNREESLTLGILESIEEKSDVTQRHLANQLGVALGLANSYLKRCVRKGLIKIEQAPANRYLYYLTPRGFAEKSRLTAEYLSVSFDFYRRASQSCSEVFEQCRHNHYQRILLAGVSELAEIASLRAREKGIDIIGIVDHQATLNEFISIPVWNTIDNSIQFDACVITSLNSSMYLTDYMGKYINKNKVFIPDILGIKYDV